MVGTYDIEALEWLAVIYIHISNKAKRPVGYRGYGHILYVSHRTAKSQYLVFIEHQVRREIMPYYL